MKRRVYTVQGRNGYYGIDERYEGLDTTVRMVDACSTRKAAEKYAGNLNDAVARFIHDNALDREACEGFKNYETAQFALVTDNDRGLLNDMLDSVRDILSTTRALDKSIPVAEMLIERFESTAHIQFTHHSRERAAIYESWLQASANRVDWIELARHYIAKVEEGVSA